MRHLVTQDTEAVTTEAMSGTLNLYDNVYSDFGSQAEAAVRREAFGEDIGQSSWLTAAEWLRFADQAQVREGCRVLEVGSGSGGPAVYLASARGCRVTGVDINQNGVRNGARLAGERGVANHVTFVVADAARPLPFPPASFDAVLSNDAICHLSHRLEALREWARLLKPGRRMLFTDALVVTGMIAHEEIAARASIGRYLFVPPGENERLIDHAGFTLLSAEDVTQAEAEIAGRWRAARERHRDALVSREGEANFEGLQRFLDCVQRLAAERRLSRYAYLAEKK